MQNKGEGDRTSHSVPKEAADSVGRRITGHAEQSRIFKDASCSHDAVSIGCGSYAFCIRQTVAIAIGDDWQLGVLFQSTDGFIIGRCAGPLRACSPMYGDEIYAGIFQYLDEVDCLTIGCQ